MKIIIVHNQKDFDKIPLNSKEYREIKITETTDIVYINRALGNSTVRAWGNSTVRALGNSTVRAWGNSTVEALDNSTVEALDNSTVEAWGNSTVEAWGNSTVEAWGNSTVRALGNSTVRALGNSTVRAWDNSTVRALGNSTVEAWDNSTVEAWDNSTVRAWGNSTVEAFATACVHLMSPQAQVILFGFAVAFNMVKAVIKLKSKTATIITPKYKKGVEGWFEKNAIESKTKVILFKRVSKDFKTQENTSNETKWEIGSNVTCPNWKPEESECGEGKFHACSTPYFCDEFRSVPEDKYIAIEIAKKDLFAWEDPEYPHKIAFREGRVLMEVDNFGKPIK
jgi:hypothetical protein